MIEFFSRLSLGSAAPMPGLRSLSNKPRLLYAVNHAYPFSSNGYAVRTHGVAAALVALGIDVVCVTKPGLPWDREGFSDPSLDATHCEDGVRYVHLRQPSEVGVPRSVYLASAVEAFAQVLRVFRPTAVMAASNWLNALPAAIAARELGFPFYYEVRGFWEISMVSRNPAYESTSEYSDAVFGETAVARSADGVFTINRLMREELIRRGIGQEKISLVPNGFPGWPAVCSAEVSISREALGLNARYVVGYLGSFNPYEGIEDLITAVAMLREKGVDVALLLVGSSTGSAGVGVAHCPQAAAYLGLAERLGVSSNVAWAGRVSPGEAAAYYGLMDLVVIPRRPYRVCEIVSPMKAIEAAAHGKQVLLSNVAPLADLEGLCPNFSYFEKGSLDSLTGRLGELLCNQNFTPPRCEALAMRTWEENVKPVWCELNRLAHSGSRA